MKVSVAVVVLGLKADILPVAGNFGILSKANSLLQKDDFRLSAAEFDVELRRSRQSRQFYARGNASRFIEIRREQTRLGARESARRATAVSLHTPVKPDRSG
jgi:hypothetical protein